MNRYSLYSPGDSIIHSLDPRVKLAWAGLCFVLALVFNDPRYLLAVLVFQFVVALMTGKPARQLIGFWPVLVPVIFLTVLLWPLFERSGEPVFSVFGISITDTGIKFALAMGERVVIPIVGTLLLFITTSRRDIVAGLVKIGLPYQVGFGITIAFGFLPILIGTGQTIAEAQRARALELHQGNPLERLRKSASLIVPLVISAIGSVQKLAFSMESRAYGAMPGRTYLHELSLQRRDNILLLFAFVTLVAALALRFSGHGAVLPNRL